MAQCPKAKPGLCFNCGLRGHIGRNCTNHHGGLAAVSVPGPVVSGHGSSGVPSRGKGQQTQTQGRIFALTQQDAQASNTVVTGTIPIYFVFAYVLFNTAATNSFVSVGFAKKLGVYLFLMNSVMCVDTPTVVSL